MRPIPYDPRPITRQGSAVPKGRFELPRGYPHYALNVARLPVPPLRLVLRPPSRGPEPTSGLEPETCCLRNNWRKIQGRPPMFNYAMSARIVPPWRSWSFARIRVRWRICWRMSPRRQAILLVEKTSSAVSEFISAEALGLPRCCGSAPAVLVPWHASLLRILSYVSCHSPRDRSGWRRGCAHPASACVLPLGPRDHGKRCTERCEMDSEPSRRVAWSGP